MPARRLVVLCCLAVTALLVAVPARATPPLPGERIAPGVTAAGLDVSGLTSDEAAVKIDGAFGEALRAVTVSVQAADTTWTLASTDADALLDSLQSAKRALYAGRDAAGQPVDVPLVVTYTQKAVSDFVAPIAKRLHRVPRDAGLRISIRRVRVTHSRPGRDVDLSDLKKQIITALSDPRAARVIRPKLLTVKAKLNADKVRAGASTVLTIDQRTFTLRLFKRLKVVKRYKVAVGQPKYPTPRGRYSIVSKQINPVWSVPEQSLGRRACGHVRRRRQRGEPAQGALDGHRQRRRHPRHGRGRLDRLARLARLHPHARLDVIALYKRVPVGTPVLIG